LANVEFMDDLTLPDFEMNCRDWLVVTPEESGLPDEIAGSPLLAVLSTVVLEDDRFTPASGVMTVGLADVHMPAQPLENSVASLLMDCDPDGTEMRYVVPAPDGRLALLVEFALPDGPEAEVVDRVESLMRSFRWAA
jgi:hypothetical protein